MPRFSRIETINAMIEDGLVPVFYNSSLEISKKILAACADGGIRTIEFTNRGDSAVDIFRELEKYAMDNHRNIILGAGSVPDPFTASLFIQYGANLIVAPFLDKETAYLCNKRKVPYSPGCGSVTEIHNAEELGVEICKIFPGTQVGGPAFIKALTGPCPRSNIMPTGGVEPTEESLSAWFNSGAACVGLGSSLIPSVIGNDFDYNSITGKLIKAREILSGLKRKKG